MFLCPCPVFCVLFTREGSSAFRVFVPVDVMFSGFAVAFL